MSERNVIHENFHTKHSVLTAPDEHMPYISQRERQSDRQTNRERETETHRETETDRQIDRGRGGTGGAGTLFVFM